MMVGAQRTVRSRNGFTLLELFLTLAMAVVLVTLVNSAFTYYAKDMDSSDADMRRTMLASAVMQMIEDDLRAALHPEPLDTAPLEALLSSTAAAAGQALGGAAGDPADMAAAGIDSPEEDSTTEVDSSLAVGVAVLETPGLIGNQFQIQIDTSRLPRLEEYTMLMDSDLGNLQDVPSDLKTVTYFVQAAGMMGVDDPLNSIGSPSSTGELNESGGLVRRVLDRSATTFASLRGNVASLSQTGDLIAPEIAAIEFSYWDGIMWQIEWNSDEMGELPLAIRIQMTMSDPDSQLDGMADQSEPRVFQHIVRLPMAKLIEEEEEEDGMTELGI